MGVEESENGEYEDGEKEHEEHSKLKIKNHLRDEPEHGEEEMESHDYSDIRSHLGDDLAHNEAEMGSVGSHEYEESAGSHDYESADGDDEMSESYLWDELGYSEVETESLVEDIEEGLQEDMNNKAEVGKVVYLDQAEVTVHEHTYNNAQHFTIPEISITMVEDQILETTAHHHKVTGVQHTIVTKAAPPELTDIPSAIIINVLRSEPDLDPPPPPRVDTSMGLTLVDRGEVFSVIEVAEVDEEVNGELRGVDGIVSVDEAKANMERWWRDRGASMWKGGVGIGFSGWRKM